MKKRLLSVFLALVLCVGLAVPAFAADSDFVIENGVLMKYAGPGGNVIIPSGVTAIDPNAFDSCVGRKVGTILMTGITIPGSVTEINDYVFIFLEDLTSVTIGDGVTTIGTCAFAFCFGLTSITLPSSVTTIKGSAFQFCDNLKSITIPKSVTSIEWDAFSTRVDSDAYVPIPGLTIYGEAGSYAESFAKENGIPFVAGAAPKFTDVPAGAFYADAVNWAVEQDITNGTGAASFSPGRDCTHAQILTFLYRAARGEGTAAAEDMDKAISWAREKGMIGADFNSSAQCTRADAVNYIWQAFGKESAAVSSFNDVPAGAGYAAAVDWAVANGITDGTGNGNFSPNKVCNRGTIVTFLHRAYVPEARLK